jgi:hypothetical protein
LEVIEESLDEELDPAPEEQAERPRVAAAARPRTAMM